MVCKLRRNIQITAIALQSKVKGIVLKSVLQFIVQIPATFFMEGDHIKHNDCNFDRKMEYIPIEMLHQTYHFPSL